MEPKALRAKVETRRKGWRERAAGRGGGGGDGWPNQAAWRRGRANRAASSAPRRTHARRAGQPAARDEAPPIPPPITRKSASEPFRR